MDVVDFVIFGMLLQCPGGIGICAAVVQVRDHKI